MLTQYATTTTTTNQNDDNDELSANEIWRTERRQARTIANQSQTEPVSTIYVLQQQDDDDTLSKITNLPDTTNKTNYDALFHKLQQEQFEREDQEDEKKKTKNNQQQPSSSALLFTDDNSSSTTIQQEQQDHSLSIPKHHKIQQQPKKLHSSKQDIHQHRKLRKQQRQQRYQWQTKHLRISICIT